MSEKPAKTTQNYPLQVPFELLDKFKAKSEETKVKLSELMVTALHDYFKPVQLGTNIVTEQTEIQQPVETSTAFIFEHTPNA